MDSTELRHILVRHEQGAGHAAEGYASASGKVGVAIATSGPGATNLVTAIADAYHLADAGTVAAELTDAADTLADRFEFRVIKADNRRIITLEMNVLEF